MRKLILSTKETGAGRQFLVEPDRPVVFGRCAPAEICLGDKFMSSRHFEIEHDGRKAEVSDLKSSNGTFVNEHRVSRAEVFDGDIIKSGQTIFVVSWEVAVNHPTDTIPPKGRSATSESEKHVENSFVPNSPPFRPTPPISSSAQPVGWLRAEVSPFDFGSESPSVATPAEKLEDPQGLHDDFPGESGSNSETLVRMRRSLAADELSIGAFDLTEELTRFFSTVVVADFWKIGESLPTSLERWRIWDDPGLAGPWSPVVVPSPIWLAEVSRDWTDRLSRSDGWMLILMGNNIQSQFAEDALRDGCRRLSFRQVLDFSEQGGLNAWFWPSMLQLLAEASPDEGVEWLFEDGRLAWLFRQRGSVSRFEAFVHPTAVSRLNRHRFDA